MFFPAFLLLCCNKACNGLFYHGLCTFLFQNTVVALMFFCSCSIFVRGCRLGDRAAFLEVNNLVVRNHLLACNNTIDNFCLCFLYDINVSLFVVLVYRGENKKYDDDDEEIRKKQY